MERALMEVTVKMNVIGVMGESFKTDFVHTIDRKGHVGYTVSNPLGRVLEKHKKKVLKEDAARFFEVVLHEARVTEWENAYYSDACGGFRWEINLGFDEGEPFHSHGYIKLPPRWAVFAKAVKEATGFPLYVETDIG